MSTFLHPAKIISREVAATSWSPFVTDALQTNNCQPGPNS